MGRKEMNNNEFREIKGRQKKRRKKAEGKEPTNTDRFLEAESLPEFLTHYEH